MKTIGYAVVGTGYFGGGLARILASTEGARLAAVLDPENADAVAAELGCAVETDLEAICARPDVDAVVVATPNCLHREPVLAAARAGRHVFCEKPVALSYADCDAMVAEAKKAGVYFMAGHVMNFMGGVRKAKALINEGRIGRLLFCHSERNGWEDSKPAVSWKKMRDKSGGHLYHHIHELDFIQFLMGPAKTAFMRGGNVAHADGDFGDEDDMLLITLDFGNGTFATQQYGSAFRWSDHYVKIQGTEGAILIDMHDVGVTLKTASGVERFLLHESREEDEDRTSQYRGFSADGAIAYGSPGRRPPRWLWSIMKKEMAYFHGLMNGATPDPEFAPLLDGSAARAAIATADALTLSLRENRLVDIAEVTEVTNVSRLTSPR